MTTRIGLTLGKYAPLHRGHQLVIETALAEMDEVVVLIYDAPETTAVPLPVRSAWLRELHPRVRVVESWDGPTQVGDTPEIRLQHDEYLTKRFAGWGITHFYSSEFYGEHVSRALGAVDRRVDPERRTVPARGTEIRRDPYASRALLHPRVYRDLVRNVVFLGAPSTGKSTLAERLAADRRTVWMPEYGREYWHRHQQGRRLTPVQLVELAEGHLEREEALLREARGELFTDTNALTTYVYSFDYHGHSEPRLAELADAAARRYDLTFLCDTDIPHEDTEDRSGPAHRRTMQKRIIAELARRRIPFITLSGSVRERIALVERALARFPHYGNPIGGGSWARP